MRHETVYAMVIVGVAVTILVTAMFYNDYKTKKRLQSKTEEIRERECRIYTYLGTVIGCLNFVSVY